MITTIYIFILSYFILGGIGFYFINRRKDKESARKSWTKFIAYFFIIHILYFAIVLHPKAFPVVSYVIVAVGTVELFGLFFRGNLKNKSFFLVSMLLYGGLSYGFLAFANLKTELVLFAFLVLSIFDAFSQISGQLWGKSKIVPAISPNKTIGGTVGGSIFAILSAVFLNYIIREELYVAVLMAAGTVIFAFLGDLAASFFKRKYKVKDYSNLIPGHGGFLDRFDSLIAGGAWIAFYVFVFL